MARVIIEIPDDCYNDHMRCFAEKMGWKEFLTVDIKKNEKKPNPIGYEQFAKNTICRIFCDAVASEKRKQSLKSIKKTDMKHVTIGGSQ